MAGDELSQHIQLLVTAIGDQTRAIGDQTRAIGDLAKSIGATHLDHESRLRKIEEITITLKERMTLWNLAQTAYSTIAAAVASAIALLRK